MSKFFFKQDNKQNLKLVWKSFLDYIGEFKKNKKDFSIEIKKVGTKPSGRQRGYYYGVVVPAIKKAYENAGNIANEKDIDEDLIKIIKTDEESIKIEKEKLDYDLREKMGFTEVNENIITGTMSIRIKSFSDLAGDKEEVTEYITKVIIWAEDFFEIKIPRPELRGYDFLLNER